MEEIVKCIAQAAEYTHQTCGITNEQGRIIACSDENRVKSEDYFARDLLLSREEFVVAGESSYRRIQDSTGNDYVCFVEGTEPTSQAYLQLLCAWMTEILRDGSTELNRETLLKNILLENELPGDIPLKAREYRIPYSVPRIALLVHMPQVRNSEMMNTLRSLLPNRRADFILSMDEENIVILTEIGQDYQRQVAKLTEEILEAFPGSEDQGMICMGVGMPADTLKDCAKSYREASLALTVGSIFESDSPVVYYDKLGLGRLIYQLPATLCHMFLDEVFPNDAYDNLDNETLLTINQFFDNNLNGSETARQLFVHRNTLVYRLDKVQKITNLDLRNFEDAVLFKLASMVRKYLECQNAGHPNKNTTRWWKS